MEDIRRYYVRCTRVKRSTRGVGLLQPPGSQMGSEEMVDSRLLQTPEEPRRLIPGADGRKLPLLSIMEAGAGGLSRTTHRHEQAEDWRQNSQGYQITRDRQKA